MDAETEGRLREFIQGYKELVSGIMGSNPGHPSVALSFPPLLEGWVVLGTRLMWSKTNRNFSSGPEPEE